MRGRKIMGMENSKFSKLFEKAKKEKKRVN
jgi:hypothetical protein